MKPKMKKNPDFRRNGANNGNRRGAASDYDSDDDLGFGDKKYANRRERRVFSTNNISRYYKEHLEPRMKAEEREDNLIDAEMTDK